MFNQHAGPSHSPAHILTATHAACWVDSLKAFYDFVLMQFPLNSVVESTANEVRDKGPFHFPTVGLKRNGPWKHAIFLNAPPYPFAKEGLIIQFWSHSKSRSLKVLGQSVFVYRSKGSKLDAHCESRDFALVMLRFGFIERRRRLPLAEPTSLREAHKFTSSTPLSGWRRGGYDTQARLQPACRHLSGIPPHPLQNQYDKWGLGSLSPDYSL